MPEGTSVVTLISGTLAFFLNLFLVFVIIQNRRSSIGSYSYLLLLYSVSAMLYAITQILTLPTFLVTNKGYTFHETLHILPTFWGTVAVFSFVSCYVQNVVILACSFVYRYLTLCNPLLLERLSSPWNTFLVILFNLSIIAYVMFNLVYFLGPSEVAESVLGPNFFTQTGVSLSEIGYLGAPMIVNDSFYLPVMFSLGTFIVFVVSASVLIAFCIYRTVALLKQKVTESCVASRYHRRVFTLLILQLTMPLIFNFIPVLLVIASSYFSLPFGRLSLLIGSIMTFAQVIDPILVFVYVEYYQNYVRSLVPCLPPGSRVASTHTHSQVALNSNKY